MFQRLVFSSEAAVSCQRSPEDQVTNTLMLELGALLRRTERQPRDRASLLSHGSSWVEYSWLADPPRPSFVLNPRGAAGAERPVGQDPSFPVWTCPAEVSGEKND